MGYFEGWYFKQQAGDKMAAFIPAIHSSGGKRSGSIQVVTADKTYFVEVPEEAIRVQRRPLAVCMGHSTFSLDGLDLDIQHRDVTVTGSLHYTGRISPAGDIMGPYRFVPLMECRHSVFSLAHAVTGSVSINGEHYDFTGGLGYVEGDRGRSFPKRYVWTQCSRGEDMPWSLMLSAAEVRPLGRAFTGIIGFVFDGRRELRFATYKGARLLSSGDGMISVHQGNYILTAQLLEDRALALRAPTSGDMVRLIKESLTCRARYTLSDNGTMVFDVISDQASFEYEF